MNCPNCGKLIGERSSEDHYDYHDNRYSCSPKEARSLERAGYDLPAVGGRRIDCSLAEFERRCKIYMGREQRKLDADNGIIALLCDAVRLAREYGDEMNRSVGGGVAEDHNHRL